MYEDDKLKLPIKQKLNILVLYFISSALSYLVLLALFTLDFGLLMAAVVGYSVGFAVFGFKRKKTFIYLYNPKADKCQLEIEY